MKAAPYEISNVNNNSIDDSQFGGRRKQTLTQIEDELSYGHWAL